MRTRIDGIDYLRAIMSVFVVVWHMGGGGRSLIFSKADYLEHVFTVSDFVNFHLLLLAVPTFIFVSIFLYASKPITNAGLKKRIVRITVLITFWTVALVIYRGSYDGLIAIFPISPDDFVYMILRAGSTPYYYFISLIICVFISHFFSRLHQNFQISLFILSVILLAFIPALTKLTDFFPLSAFWSPLNFIPLSFAAVLAAQNKDAILHNRKTLLLVSFVFSTIFSILEWKYSVGEIFFRGQRYAIPAYTRTSLLFATFGIILIALDSRIRARGVIKFMSKYSLALYCLHPFLMRPAKDIVTKFIQNETVGLYVSIIFVITASYALALLLKSYFLKDKVII